MPDPYRRDTIDNWVGDYLESARFREQTGLILEYAPEVLATLLGTACDARDVEPADVEEADLKTALLDGVGRMEIPASVREHVPTLCAAFLEEMETQGRLGQGRLLGLHVQALKEPYLDATSDKGKPIVAPAAKVGRNDPCPCGSGRKYKKCCMGRLDG